MAGCSQCADVCNCNIVDELGNPYNGTGTPTNPFVIPRAQNTKWQGTSPNGDLVITEGDVVPANDDGHAPTFAVNWCNGVEDIDVDSGNVLVTVDGDDDCRPKRLRDPLPGEFMGQTEDGTAGWVQGAVISMGAVPLGVPMEFWGDESSVPALHVLCAGQLVNIADYPALFAVIGHNGNAGVDPGGGQFRIPDKRGFVAAGRDNMGGTAANRLTDPNADIVGGSLGVEAASLAIANLPAHTHPLTVNSAATGLTVVAGASAVTLNAAATGVAILNAGTHLHSGAGASHNFLVEDTTPAGGYQYLDRVAVNVDTANTMRFSSNGTEGGNSVKPNREGNTVLAGDHAHGTSDPTHNHGVNNNAHGHGVSDPTHGHTGTANANANQTGTAVSRVQPTQAVNYIMRVA